MTHALQEVTGPPKFWQETVEKKNFPWQTCATSHEKAQVTARAQKTV